MRPTPAICTDCDAAIIDKMAADKAREEKALPADKGKKPETMADDSWGSAKKPVDIPKNAQPLARSENGEIAIYTIDTPDVLTLMFSKGGSLQTLFENGRKPGKVAEAK